MNQNRYATARAFRRALEDRLMAIAQTENRDIQRLRREVSFDRLLARLFAGKDAPWVLKGGYAMELRIKEARATRDIDLALRETFGKAKSRTLNEAILESLKAASAADLGDYFEFSVGAPMMDLDAAPYGGARFPVEARVDARTFGKFHLDVGAGDAVVTPLEIIADHDWLSFADIPGGRFPAIPREQQFAEKLHAYTLPRKTPNSRARDLVDMLLLINSGKLKKERVAEAIKITFERRKTHPVQASLVPPPAAWEKPFAALAVGCELSPDMAAAFVALAKYFDALAGRIDAAS